MDDKIFAELPSITQSSLAHISKAVEGMMASAVRRWPIALAELPTEKPKVTLLREVAAWAQGSQRCLYYFQCTTQQVNLAEVSRAFASAKQTNPDGLAFPRLNHEAACFYVGSSQSIAKRLAEHLGYGAKKTYAMQLRHWATALPIDLELVCAKYPNDTPQEALQALEDALWQHKAPMFGRLGRR